MNVSNRWHLQVIWLTFLYINPLWSSFGKILGTLLNLTENQ